MTRRYIRTEWGERPKMRQIKLLSRGDTGSHTVITQLDFRNGEFVFIIPVTLANQLQLDPYGRYLVTFIHENEAVIEEQEVTAEVP